MKFPQLVFLAVTLAFAGCSTPRPCCHRDVVTQASTYDALARGLYDGGATLESLRGRGDFGVGTLHGWNGEVVVLDGRFHLIDGAGHGELIMDYKATTPFLELTWFDADETRRLPAATTYGQLRQSPHDFLTAVNSLYAVKITGKFRHLKARSMPTQCKPYKVMSELVKTQPTFEFNEVEGTMVGFWSPPSMNGVALAGWHLHFLTQDGRAGGHVLEFTTDSALLQLDRSLEFRWLIPYTEEYQHHLFTNAQ